MPSLDKLKFEQLRQLFTALDAEYFDWREHHRQVAQYILPRRYAWLYATPGSLGSLSKNQNASRRNESILDGTATLAVGILASGLMNTITNPARPWFKLGFKGFQIDGLSIENKQYLEECARRMQIVMLRSNYYQAVHTLYLDLAAFGTAGSSIYEDFDSVIHCENYACGEYRLIQDDRHNICGWSRMFDLTLRQLVKQFGEENLPRELREKMVRGGAEWQTPHTVCHLVEPSNTYGSHVEYYWLRSESTGQLLAYNSYSEFPGQFPRWQTIGNDIYGTSPSMDALPDILQLQQETKRKAQSLDYMITPPLIADAALQQKPNALLPRSITYVPGSSQIGAKPAYQIQPPINWLMEDIREVQNRIRMFYHNDLFMKIHQLDTVRSAAEVQALLGENLTQLGPVAYRLSKEVLDPGVYRIFNIMRRKKLLPDPPSGVAEHDIDVTYSSILFDAQRSTGTAATERFFQLIGQLAPSVPEIMTIPDFPELVKDYADRLNLPSIGIKTEARILAERQAQQQQLAVQQAALVGDQMTNAGKNLSQMDIGGGQNALQALLGR